MNRLPDGMHRPVIYFAADRNGLTKIGVTHCLYRRLRSLNLHRECPLRVVRIVSANVRPFKYERLIHSHLACFRTTGEWFILTNQQIMAAGKYLRQLVRLKSCFNSTEGEREAARRAASRILKRINKTKKVLAKERAALKRVRQRLRAMRIKT